MESPLTSDVDKQFIVSMPITNNLNIKNDNNNKDTLFKMSFKLSKPWYKHISVEPVMFMYMFAQMLTNVIEQDLVVQKVCRVNLNLSTEICENVKQSNFSVHVQKTTSIYYQWECVAAHIFPMFLALYLGAFSDLYGRKLPLMIGLSGKLIYSVMMVLNAYMINWPLKYIIFTATLPSALTASDVAIFASCFAYISDVSSVKNRTMRVTILDVCYLSAMPIGIALGNFLFNHIFEKSHTVMFALNAGIQICALVSAYFLMDWQTTTSQHSMSHMSIWNIFQAYFQFRHIASSYRVLTRKRPANRRAFLIMLLISMALYTFQREENIYLFLYATFKFKWDVNQYSNFKTTKTCSFVLAMLLVVPLLNKIFKWRDSSIVFLGTLSHAVARFFYAMAPTVHLFYVGGIISGLGPIVGPMIRAMTSKLVPEYERGRVFALLSVCDNAVPFIGAFIYSSMYRLTLNEKKTGGGGYGVFLVTITTQLMVMILVLIIHIIIGNRKMFLADWLSEDSCDAVNNMPNDHVENHSYNLNNDQYVIFTPQSMVPSITTESTTSPPLMEHENVMPSTSNNVIKWTNNDIYNATTLPYYKNKNIINSF